MGPSTVIGPTTENVEIFSCYNRRLYHEELRLTFIWVPILLVMGIFAFTINYQLTYQALPIFSMVGSVFLGMILSAFNKKLFCFGARTMVSISTDSLKIVRTIGRFRREEIYLAKDFVRVRWTFINIGSTQLPTYVGGLFLDRAPVRTYHIGDSFKTILTNISPEEADMLATKIAAVLKWHYDGVIGDFSDFSKILLPRHIRERVKAFKREGT
ncbi:MAG: hypothetical protein EOP04_01225 [Proteobacteria bacterium]|nr:MAG: hypothetical protein EOP04_01225 [Pseudomonadota bacterium]